MRPSLHHADVIIGSLPLPSLDGWRGRAVALALGLVSATGFQPLNLWPLTLAVIALFMMMAHAAQSRWGALALGWWFGLGHFTLGLNWIATSFTYQAAMPVWLGWVAVLLLSLFLAIYPAVATGLAWRFGRGNAFRFTLLFAAAWMLTEWLRGYLFTGFAWNPLGAVWTPLLPVAQSARWIGALGLSGLAILAAGLPMLLANRNWRGAGGVAVVLMLIGLAGLWVLSTPAAPEGARVRIVQPNIGQEEKWDEASGEAIARRFAELSGAPDGSPRLLMWPEASVRDYLEEEPAARARLARLLGPRDLLLTGGISLVWDDKGEVEAARNSLFVMDAGERLVARYDKAHLVPYGEYLPMRPLLSAIGLSRLAPGDLDFLAGPGPRSLALPGFGSAGIQICYEIIFPGRVVDPRHRPDFLFNASNDAWFGSWGPPQHLTQARLRAIEEGLPVARATPTGISAVIDPQGRVRASLPHRTAGVIDARMPLPDPPTLFAQAGEWTSAAFGLMLVLMALRQRRRRSIPT